ncbi:hypothetical protein E2C01_074969 [Portunus trituberculatus]|uniref:Uncharacterized protein n=1 Tax=Portunus trituberculatus TaxID=210409 RepID=A0A5B7I4U8_PORTR|nr:hypothetical protein [Portunus trituberculatus]
MISGKAQVYSSGGKDCGVCAASLKHASLNTRTSPPSPHPKHAHITTAGKLTNTPPSSALPATRPPSTCLSNNASAPPILPCYIRPMITEGTATEATESDVEVTEETEAGMEAM